MRGSVLLIVWAATTMVNAAEPSLGDRRLFFSGQERQSMAVSDESLRSDDAAPRVSKKRGVQLPKSSIKTKTQPSFQPSARSTTLIVNGFIEASGSLTLFVNGKPCESVSLAMPIPRKIDCQHSAGLLPPGLSLVRVDEYQLTIKKSDGDNIVLDRLADLKDET